MSKITVSIPNREVVTQWVGSSLSYISRILTASGIPVSGHSLTHGFTVSSGTLTYERDVASQASRYTWVSDDHKGKE